ncbi:MAG: hypothetical protein EOP39_04230 [Rubrivivax sp.]|nr:MAG: hypothetical protein EOP39_04230 [Rubrivivax sp.]
MSAALTPKQLAEIATRMPWEKTAPVPSLAEFRAAVTPELFLELLEALSFGVRFFDQLTPADAERMRKVLVKAGGAS